MYNTFPYEAFDSISHQIEDLRVIAQDLRERIVKTEDNFRTIGELQQYVLDVKLIKDLEGSNLQLKNQQGEINANLKQTQDSLTGLKSYSENQIDTVSRVLTDIQNQIDEAQKSIINNKINAEDVFFIKNLQTSTNEELKKIQIALTELKSFSEVQIDDINKALIDKQQQITKTQGDITNVYNTEIIKNLESSNQELKTYQDKTIAELKQIQDSLVDLKSYSEDQIGIINKTLIDKQHQIKETRVDITNNKNTTTEWLNQLEHGLGKIHDNLPIIKDSINEVRENVNEVVSNITQINKNRVSDRQEIEKSIFIINDIIAGIKQDQAANIFKITDLIYSIQKTQELKDNELKKSQKDTAVEIAYKFEDISNRISNIVASNKRDLNSIHNTSSNYIRDADGEIKFLKLKFNDESLKSAEQINSLIVAVHTIEQQLKPKPPLLSRIKAVILKHV